MFRSVFAIALRMLALTPIRALQWPDCRGVTVTSDTETYSIPECGCDVTFLEITCRVSEPTQPIRMAINCHKNISNFSAIPDTDLPRMNFKLYELALTSCDLPSKFASLLARLGQDPNGVLLEMIRLEELGGELRREHVQGLIVKRISIIDSALQNSIPFDALNALPDLEEFQMVRASQFQLVMGNGNDAMHPSLKLLQLLSCGITDIPPGAFARLPFLKELCLGGNSIKKFTSDAFKGLQNLETLSLSINPLVELPPHSFASTPRLRSLHLDETHLRALPGDAFEGLQHLEVITIKDGKDTIKFGAQALAMLPALKEIFISTTLEPLPIYLIEGSTDLEELTITKAGLETIPQGFFSTQRRLMKLDLSRNKIKALNAYVFQPLKALYELNLDRNYIEEFPDNLFHGLPKLKSLSANYNHLKIIAENAFDSSFINYLSLNYNELTSEVLSGLRLSWVLPHLEQLLLQGNRITHVIPDWQRLDKLKKLDLTRNNFTELKEMHIMFHSLELEIDLRHNQITNIKMDPIIPGLSETGRYVTHVYLGDNPFKCDCELYSFIEAVVWSNQHFVSALKLDLEFSQCASPPDLVGKLIRDLPLSSLTCSLPLQDCPANCSCIVRPATHSLELDCETEPSVYPDPETHKQKTTKLRLSTNPSVKLPFHVVSLNLSGLGLTEPPSIKKLQSIKELDLTQNSLITAPFEFLEANISLRLTRNPFACDCDHLASVYALQNNADLIVDADNVTCVGGESLMYINADKLCEVRMGAVLGGSFAAFGLLIAILAGFAYRFSLQMKVFLFSRGWCQFCVKEEEVDNAEYDAFVSFSQVDAQWVAETLVPKLEEEPNNFKLCVHYRDWVVGDMIPAQIASSIEQSRRTIVVLTDNFLKSTWALLEFRAANARAQRERHARVLVIVLGEIPDCDEMDAELRAYLTTNTYLKWGDPWFWEKLMYAMPHRR